LASQSPAQHINVLQRPIFRAIPKTAPTHMFSVKQTLGRYIMQIITERNNQVPKNITHVKGKMKFEKYMFFGKGNLMVVGNHLT
jgi:hypothetical protein